MSGELDSIRNQEYKKRKKMKIHQKNNNSSKMINITSISSLREHRRTLGIDIFQN